MKSKLTPQESEAQQMAHKVGVKIKHTSGGYQSNDTLTLDCLICETEINQKYLMRKIKEKAQTNDQIYCRYCNVNAAIPAIQAYFHLQSVDKMTEKDARAKVITEHGVNPSSLWQSFRNDYRDDKLTQACRTLLEDTFPDKLDKKKPGNKFTDEHLVSFLEKLYGETPLNIEEKLQSAENTIIRFRKKKADGTLPPELESRLLAIQVNLTPAKVFTSEERLEQLNSFIDTHNRLPRAKEFEEKRKAGDADAGLYVWQRDVFFKLKNGEISDKKFADQLSAIQVKINSV